MKPPKLLQVAAASALSACLFTLTLSGCGRGNAKNRETTDSSASSSSTTTPSNLGVAPTVPAASDPVVAVTVTAEPGGLETIEAANQNLWDAWRDDDRPRALAFATTAAVDSLFLTKWGPEVRNQGCGTPSGIPRCVYTLRGGARVVLMGQNTSGFFVSGIETVGALPSSNRLQSEIVDDTVVFDEASNATDVAYASDAEELGDFASQDGSEAPLTLAPGSDDGSSETGTTDGLNTGAPTVPGPASSGSTNSAKPRAKRTTRKAIKTTKRKRKTTVASPAASAEPAPSPDPAPAPAPTPAPAPGPVQAGRTVETVAP
jgi:hypothetical protein